jgi:hypothetical protein
MTRPDPRLLVPCDALPFVPAGATLEDHDGNRCVAGDAGGPEDFPGCLLDLSAPALRDGIPERMDALPWALAVLGWLEAPTLDCYGYVAPVHRRWPNATTPPRWSDLDLAGLTPDEASRAVVAAALRGGR